MSTTVEAAADKDTYLADFERFEREPGNRGRPALQRLRQSAAQRFRELGFPTLRNEDWRFTNVAPLARTWFRLAGGAPDGVTASGLRPRALGMDAACRLVFVNGRFAPELSALP